MVIVLKEGKQMSGVYMKGAIVHHLCCLSWQSWCYSRVCCAWSCVVVAVVVVLCWFFLVATIAVWQWACCHCAPLYVFKNVFFCFMPFCIASASYGTDCERYTDANCVFLPFQTPPLCSHVCFNKTGRWTGAVTAHVNMPLYHQHTAVPLLRDP